MIKKDQIQHLAKLARISLNEKEKKKFQKELSSILDYFNLLEEIDTTRIKPTFHFFPLENVIRKDEIKKETPERIEKLIKAVPAKEKRYIKIKTKGIFGG